ncbi:hypothetical protein N8T08_005638 [Aspergillus melleus]|uniref:Uncharacterized protein n=1 Tax=Aspergillus melleus TaxID=138277 RepID=A0ACC3B269_9EURO|nr:hypothetical protein N8T08_005638 [Aspergillus melleus]
MAAPLAVSFRNPGLTSEDVAFSATPYEQGPQGLCASGTAPGLMRPQASTYRTYDEPGSSHGFYGSSRIDGSNQYLMLLRYLEPSNVIVKIAIGPDRAVEWTGVAAHVDLPTAL